MTRELQDANRSLWRTQGGKKDYGFERDEKLLVDNSYKINKTKRNNFQCFKWKNQGNHLSPGGFGNELAIW